MGEHGRLMLGEGLIDGMSVKVGETGRCSRRGDEDKRWEGAA